MPPCLSLLHHMVSQQENPWNLVAKIFSQRRRKIRIAFYCIIWPHVGNPSVLIASNEEHLSKYPKISKKIVVLDKYQDVSAKDHGRMWQASGAVLDYELSIASHTRGVSCYLNKFENVV